MMMREVLMKYIIETIFLNFTKESSKKSVIYSKAYHFENDINIARDQASNMFALCGLHRVILFLVVVAKVKSERIWRGCPLFNSLQWINVQELFGFLVNTNYGVLGDSKQTSYQFILAFHFLLDKKERHAVCLQRST